MTRIALPDDATVAAVLRTQPAQLQQAAEQGGLINVFRALLRSPEVTISVGQLASTLFTATALTDIDRELVILACGTCYSAPYETAQHEPISAALGVTDAQRAAIAARQWDAGCLSPAQQALLRFVAAITAAPTVEEVVFDAVREHYDDRQVVETIVITGMYFLIGRITTVLDVPLDPPADDTVLRAVRSLSTQH